MTETSVLSSLFIHLDCKIRYEFSSGLFLLISTNSGVPLLLDHRSDGSMKIVNNIANI